MCSQVQASRRYKPTLYTIWEDPSDGFESKTASIVDEDPAVDTSSNETVGEKPVLDNTQGSHLAPASSCSGVRFSQGPRRKQSFWRRLLCTSL
jgi:hypothetical protein